MTRLIRACALGFLAAVPPAAAFAAEGSSEVASRALPGTGDAPIVAFITVIAVVALLLVASLGFLYRRERHLDWDFQRPDPPRHDGGHH